MSQRVRRFIFIALTYVIMRSCQIYPWTDMLTYFTNWGLLATYFTCISGTIISQNKGYTLKNAPNLHALHHLMYTLMLFMTPIVIVMYWGLVHKQALIEIREENKDEAVY